VKSVVTSVLFCSALGCAEVVGADFDEARAQDPPRSWAPDEHAWSTSFGDGAEQRGSDIAILPDGTIITVGSFKGTIQLTNHSPLISAGYEDIFVIALDSSGELAWAKSYGSISSDTANAVDITPDGDIVIVGTYGAEIDFGSNVLSSHGGWDGFVAKLTPSGDARWSLGFGEAEPQFAYTVEALDSGDIAVAGGFKGDIVFETGATLSANIDGEDAFVSLFDSSGNLHWIKSYAGDQLQIVSGLAARADDVFVYGTYQHTVSFGAGWVVDAGDLSEGFVLALSRQTGDTRWVARLGYANTYASAEAVGVLSNGDVVAASGAAEAVNVEGDFSLTHDRVNVLLTRLDGVTGQTIWVHEFGDELNPQVPSALVVGPNDDMAVVGDFQGLLEFGDGSFASLGARDGFLARFDSDGTPYSLRAMVGAGEQRVHGVALDESGRAYVIGSSIGTSDWGGAVLEPGGAYYDAVVAAYDP
jgi:hypothetical protein